MTKFEKQKLNWKKQRAKGRTRFILSYLLAWEFGSVIIASLYNLRNQAWIKSLNDKIFSYIVSLITYGIVGIILAFLRWRSNEEKFRD